MQNSGSHTHSGNTGNWLNWRQTTINHTAVPGYVSPYHIVSNPEINAAGDHGHVIYDTGAGSVMPDVYLTVCKKD